MEREEKHGRETALGGWSLVLEEGTATFNMGHENGGSAIDLLLQSPALQNRGWVSECRTRPDLATGADHEVIWTVMEPLQRQAAAERQQQGKSRFAERKMDVKAFTEALRPLVEGLGEKTRAAEEAARNENPLASRQIEEAAETCQSAIVAALSASTPVRTGKRGGYEWWTAECAKAHKAMTAARMALQRRRSAPRRPSRQEEVSLSENKALFRRTLSKAKQTWVRRLVDELQGNDIFKAMHWAEAKRQYRSPPLKDSDDTLHVSASAKAKLLRAVLLPTPEPADLPPLDLHVGNERTEDDIDTAGVHPSTFKKATLVALRKSGNRDPARPRSYRLIALFCSHHNLACRRRQGHLTLLTAIDSSTFSTG
ncbi:unnamed protein product [Tilletia controversa]|nr:unnamed protein product [Tilletia controversa]